MPNPLNVPITPPRVAFIDPRSGTVSREWYLFFLSLFQTVGGSSVSLDDVQKGPPALTIDEINIAIDRASANLAPSAESTVDQIAELRKTIEGMMTQPRAELGTMSELQQDNVPWLKFDTTPAGFPTGAAAAGTLYWDDADGIKTLNLIMEDSGGVVQQIGEETYYRIKADAAITNGQVIMFTGTVGASGALKGAPATGLTATQNEYIMGVATQDIAHNGWGYVTWFGLVRGIDTTGGAEAWVDGQTLYYNPAVPGGLTKTVPTAPNPKVIVASVVNAASNGSLFVRPTFGSALGSTDSNVQIGTLANGNLLIYNASTSRWENATLTAGSNVTITNGPGSITIASSNPGGTVTSVGLSAPTGFAVSGSPVTSSGTLALSFASGYSLPTNASQTNWDTAYTDRLKWDGGSTGLVAATGRTSLGATTVGSNLFTLTNPSAVTFLRVNADNTVSTLDAATFRTAIGAGTGNGTVTSVTASSPLASSGGTAPNITITGSALTKTDDTNVTLTLGGSASTALLAAASLTLGWTGQLAVSRGGTGLSSLTAGYIPFGNGTSAFGSDSQLFWDNTNKRLGVNNTGPTYSIDTIGTIRSTSQAVFNSNYTSALPVIVACDNAATSAVLLIRKGRDIGAGSVDAVGFDALTASYSALVPMVMRGSVVQLVSGGGEGARVDSNAYLLVGYTASNGAYRLQVNSQIFATNATIATSDERYKEELTPVSNALDLVMALEPVSYKWKKHEIHNFVSGVDVGFSAQRTKRVLANTPYLSNIVKTNTVTLPDGSTEEFMGLADGKLIPLLAAALQELKQQFDAYKQAHP